MAEPHDWRTSLLAGATRLAVPALRRDPIGWPAYEPRQAVSAWLLPGGAVAAVWDFAAYGGSFGEDDATALVAACDEAVRRRAPLLTLVRSGGTRLQEGVAALVGIPRARLGLLALAAAGLPHLSVADAPTTGGVWISVTSSADLRVAVEGATVGFGGPRVVEAVTGVRPAAGSHTARWAYEAGLVDAVLPGADVPAWLQRALAAVAPAAGGATAGGATAGGATAGGVTTSASTSATTRTMTSTAPPGTTPTPTPTPTPTSASARTPRGADERAAGPSADSSPIDGPQQVLRARSRTRSGRDLIESIVEDPVPLRALRSDTTVAAVVGRLDGRPLVAVAVCAATGTRPTPDGYRLPTRALGLADRLGLPVLVLVDTPGAEPGTAAEQDGIAPAIGEALDALLLCRSPTLALLHGEGGSGGALAVAAADRLLVTDDAYLAALAPEGAAAALRRPAQECAELQRLQPVELVRLGVAAELVAAEDAAAAVVRHLRELAGEDPSERRAGRVSRWRSVVPHTLPRR